MWVSYSLWSQFQPQLGKEEYHCHHKRGFLRARKKEPEVNLLSQQDTTPQKIGKLAQKAVYYLYHNPESLNQEGLNYVAQKVLNLDQEVVEVQHRLQWILKQYLHYPFLQNKSVLTLTSGEENNFSEVILKDGNRQAKLLFAYDCILNQENGGIHILDFKTGKGQFIPDLRQSLVYLLAGQKLYPNQTVTASFYHLELAQESEIYSATDEELNLVAKNLIDIAQKNQQQINAYRRSPDKFNQIFPASPGKVCNYCPFTSICNYYDPLFSE
ncbi:PD-(D/E)XK nuclease family protein [Euhalothece natronophila Z-M001]|uniref:PD-(D/E)XK nuclease family protein n=1 Tax=Euhalothece natronophila Z-M001 TaxID=522448 RepID=A0A5B8NL35_9CHRO|nr:PD-(D/E)XK nuclease family protein [Euhalothece natronophila]QDZ39972.1 PD-(D/E)XK nuclease family protein [Euhalothece natronophila Z-M001]